MFRIIFDPSSGSVEGVCLKLLVIFFVCVVGVWQRNFEPEVCVPGTRTKKVARLSALSTGRFYTPKKYSWCAFLLGTESTPGP